MTIRGGSARFSMRRLTDRVTALILAGALLGGCATLPPNVERTASSAFLDTEDTRLGQAHRDEAEAHPGLSGVYLLASGLDAYVARAVLCEAADRSIDVQYYLYHADKTGRFLTHQLLKAADRGVRVRLLVDDMDLAGRDLGIAAFDAHPNAEVRIFNPFSREAGRTGQFLSRYGSVTRRMHNKSFTVDNQRTIVGGRNIGDEYFETDPKIDFADLDLLAVGPVVREVSAAFDEYWNSELAYPIGSLAEQVPTEEQVDKLRSALRAYTDDLGDSDYAEALRESELATRLRDRSLVFTWGKARALYDSPEKILADMDETDLHLSSQIRPYFRNVKSELIISSPYFVPGRRGVEFLTGLAARGVKVRILTNSLASTDVGIVHTGYAKHRKALLRAGVELYEVNDRLSRQQRREKKGKEGGGAKASLHAKTFVMDREKFFVGTLNLDPRALVHNTEIGIVVNSADLASSMARRFDERIPEVAFRLELYRDAWDDERMRWVMKEGDGEKIYIHEPHVGFWRSLGIGLLGLLPIDSQL
jgi:putative cardiolipin synthase